jgi:DNA modification methylase
VTDRCTKAHEYLFLFAKQPRYSYNAEAIAEPAQDWSTGGPGTGILATDHYGANNGGNGGLSRIAQRYKNGDGAPTRNKRSVWTVATMPYADAHFATFPEKLIEPCILAGSREGDTILDPFGGSGTTGKVAERFGRHSILIELNPAYTAMIETRTAQRGLALGVD